MEIEHLRTRLEVYLHIVWATYGRQPLIDAKIERLVHNTIHQQAKASGCEVIATGGLADHVHVLVKVPSTVSVAELTKRIKGGSSRAQSLDAPENPLRWQRSYSATSLHRSLVPRVKHYVQTQQERHAACTLWDELEVTGER